MSFRPTPAIRARVVFALCLLLVCHAPLASAQTAASGLPAEKVKQVEALISAEMERQKIPGLSVAVVADARVRLSNGYGLGWGVGTHAGWPWPSSPTSKTCASKASRYR